MPQVAHAPSKIGMSTRLKFIRSSPDRKGICRRLKECINCQTRVGKTETTLHVLEYSHNLFCNRGGAANYQVGMCSRRPHVPLGHGGHGGAELLHHRFRSSSPLTDIALPATLEANLVGHLNIHSRL